MPLMVEEFEAVIRAPVETVWEALTDFAAWPSWSTYIQSVDRAERGWRFVARGMPPVNLVWVAESTRREPPHYLEWRSVEGAQHDIDTTGWVRLEPTPEGTRLTVHFEGRPHFASRLVDRAAEVYAMLFGEPHKLLKVTLEEFKAHVEQQAQRASA